MAIMLIFTIKGVDAMPPMINNDNCVRCGLCVEICPLDILRLEVVENGKQVVVKYPEECWHCRACAIDCPKQAITMRYPLSHMLLCVDVPKQEGSCV